jgi:hypothetical protein
MNQPVGLKDHNAHWPVTARYLRQDKSPEINIGRDGKTGGFLFFDCSPQSPKGRTALCYEARRRPLRRPPLRPRFHRPQRSAILLRRPGVPRLPPRLTIRPRLVRFRAGHLRYFSGVAIGFGTAATADMRSTSWLPAHEILRTLYRRSLEILTCCPACHPSCGFC